MKTTIVLVVAVFLTGTPNLRAQTPHDVYGVNRGGQLSPKHNCVSEDIRHRLHTEAARNREALNLNAPSAAGTPQPFTFYPMAGQLDGDVFNFFFVDLDPAPVTSIDFECGTNTRDTHGGIDTEIRSFDEQVIGVPVFAVLEGTVIFAQDGFPDMNVNGGTDGNIIGIDHGGGHVSWYFHLKNGSVAVSVGENVVAGQQIGQVGSSGNSFSPHLHFEVTQDGVPYEPFAGPCREGESGWSMDQGLLNNHDSYLHDFAITTQDLDKFPGFPFPMPRDGYVRQSDTHVRFWLRGFNLPVQSDWRVRFFRPDGTVALEAMWFFFNDIVFRTYWFPWEFEIARELPDMLTTPGTWRVVVNFAGTEMGDAPFEVVPADAETPNRPPHPIVVAFDPAQPESTDVTACLVESSNLIDDPDYDVLRYHYQWTVNGETVRDITSAARSDYLAVNTTQPGDLLECIVTPSDGEVDGQPSDVSVIIGGLPVPGDFDNDGDVDLSDYEQFVNCVTGPDIAATPDCQESADLTGDGDIDLIDFGQWTLLFTGSL